MRKTITTPICDVDETEPGQTVRFGLDGRDYELELCPAHDKALADMAAKWIACARRVGVHRPPRGPASRTAAARRQTAEIRAWALARGEHLDSRGRIPARVKAEWEREHAR